MNYSDYLENVKTKIKVKSTDEIKRIIEASLATLAERLNETDVEKLGAQLPVELKQILRTQKPQDRFLLEEYYNRVGARAGIGYPDAVHYSRAVMSVLKGAVTGELLEYIKSKLPSNFNELFGAEPSGPLSPTNIPGE